MFVFKLKYAIFALVSGDGVALSSKVCYKCKRIGHLARDCTATDVEGGVPREDRGTAPAVESESDLTGISSTQCKMCLRLGVVFFPEQATCR